MSNHFKQPMPSPMGHQFSRVPRADIPRSRFDRSHGHKTTLNPSRLYPIFVDEVLPGDTMSMRPTVLARMATPMFPIMDNLHLDTFFFFVPYRLVWDNWNRFMGERSPNPNSSIDFVVPQLNAPSGGFPEGTLADFFGIPPLVDSISVSALPFRAWNLIYNEWFRDQNLVGSAVVNTNDGPDTYSDYALHRRGKRHDYFTSCLPWPQKGPQVTMPLGTKAPISGIGIVEGATQTTPINLVWETGAGTTQTYPFGVRSNTTGIVVRGTAPGASVSGPPDIYADLSVAAAAAINDLREAFQMQRFLERDARGGTRYTEIILSHFGVSSPDARLQRPEFLGGGSQPVSVTPVASATDTADRPVGDLGAASMTVSRKGGFHKSFTEHGIIIGLANIRADLTYQKGIERFWSRETRYDFYWPVFAHLGEQAVLNKEIYAQGTGADDEVFGYQERYAEYRYKPSILSNLMRSDAVGSIDSWHLSQDFSSLPLLNQSFIEENVPLNRVVAVPSQPAFIVDCWFDYKCARPMPTYSVPGLIDHF